MGVELLRQVAVEREQAPTPHAPREQVTWLVDNAAACEALLSLVDDARESIWISQLAFDADCAAYVRVTDDDGDERIERTLLSALLEAAARGVQVCLLLNESLLLDTASPLRAHLATLGATGHIHVRGISRFPQLLHAKLVIVDERHALMLGSPFVNGYWDDCAHRPVDARRPARELAGRPLHDLSFGVRGPAVHSLGAVLAELWNGASIGPDDEPLAMLDVPAERAPEAGQVRVARTIPGRTLPDAPDGHMEILPELLRGIRRARRFIYIEHQYLSSAAVIGAIATVLRERPLLEVIVVLNQNPDVTAYRGWQNRRLRDAGLLDHPRVGVFALWSAEGAGDALTVSQVFVHSKVLIVDDSWASVGSANLDGVSLHSYGADFTSRIGERVFRDVRNVDVNLVLESPKGGSLPAIRELRTMLWREHLRLGVADVAKAASGPERWLGRWRRRADEDAALLDGRAEWEDGRPSSTLVLPYSPRSRPRQQLEDAGVSRRDGLNLAFDPGWVQRHCSPNWVRNMFA